MLNITVDLECLQAHSAGEAATRGSGPQLADGRRSEANTGRDVRPLDADRCHSCVLSRQRRHPRLRSQSQTVQDTEPAKLPRPRLRL